MASSGQRDQRFTIQRVTRTANAMGEPDEDWSAVGKRWGAMQGLSGREVQRANQTAPTATSMVDFLPDSVTKEMTTDDRLVWHGPGGDVTLGIVHVDKTKVREGQILVWCEAAA